ncbi:MAG TPA: hypothetical protein VM143_17555 [Acidimicrobiales bacterium]|nr:hypothetical protein [Acidimicrobiales bacterium]
MHRLDQFSIDDLIGCRDAFREIRERATSMEGAAQEMASYLHQHLVDAEERPACRLVRVYKSHRVGILPRDLLDSVRADHGDIDDRTRCLTLLGTAGVEAAWNDRHASQGHKAIPLMTADAVERSPMILGLIEQLGLDVATVVDPDQQRELMGMHHKDYDVFFVPDAHGSPLVPAQDGFVVPYDVRSVVGCGGVLPSGDLFALILFVGLRLDAKTADLFRTLALSVKATLVPFTFRVFDDAVAAG